MKEGHHRDAPFLMSLEIRVISPAVRHMESNTFHSGPHACVAFGRLFSGTYLSVVEKIFLTYVYRRQIGHHDVRSGKDTLFPSHRVCGPQSRCSGQQDLREYEP